jgi:hypothetical protein
MRLKAIIILVVFAVILYLPFSVQAGSGHIFNGLPNPFSSSGSASDESSAADQYGDINTKPIVDGQINRNYMRNHMNVLKQPGHSTKECAACHTDRKSFCDTCHNYVGINPKIDY